MGSDRAHRSPQRLVADRADVVVHADACQAPKDVVGGTVEILAPLTPRCRQTLRLRCWILTGCEGFQPGDHQSTAVLAGKIDWKLIGLAHASTVVSAVGVGPLPESQHDGVHHPRHGRAERVPSEFALTVSASRLRRAGGTAANVGFNVSRQGY
jgi:hypothetical protein